jgi:hypothetical protein
MNIEAGPQPNAEEPQVSNEAEPAQKDATATEGLGATALIEQAPINWQAARELIKPPTAEKLSRQNEQWGEFLPEVAQAVVEHQHVETGVPVSAPVEVRTPTAAEIKEKSAGLRIASRVLGWLGLGGWFDRYLVNQARKRIFNFADRITIALETIAHVDKPNEQFVHDIHNLYQNAKRPEDLVWLMHDLLNQQPKEASNDSPLLPGLLHAAKISPHRVARKQVAIKAVSPEIMYGISQFLNKHGEKVAVAEPTLFKSVTRKIIRIFAGKRLEQLPHSVEAALTHVYDVLPQDGKSFTRDIYTICNEIAELPHRSTEGARTVDAILKKLRR